jgi:hypothetical protein
MSIDEYGCRLVRKRGIARSPRTERLATYCGILSNNTWEQLHLIDKRIIVIFQFDKEFGVKLKHITVESRRTETSFRCISQSTPLLTWDSCDSQTEQEIL